MYFGMGVLGKTGMAWGMVDSACECGRAQYWKEKGRAKWTIK
jgi:hypothetical protein